MLPLPRARAGDDLERTVRSALAGDAGAWRCLVGRFERLLRDIGRQYRLAPADLEDAMQTTWLQLFRRLSVVREPAALPGWLGVTMRRECLRTLQRPVAEVLVGETPTPSDGFAPDPLSELLTAERREALRQALATLPGRHRELMRLLIDAPGLSHSEIGDRLEMPIGSIGPTRARSLTRLERDPQLRRLCA
jgi:RNA polymerase sigma factor (sigma-70 family)